MPAMPARPTISSATPTGSPAGGDELFGGTDTTITALGSGNTIDVEPGKHTIAMGANNNTLTLNDGNNTVIATGTGNTVTGGTGNSSISEMTGNATITLGNGNDTVSGANNAITVGTDTLTDTGTNNTIAVPLAGQGLDTINGSVLSNGDTFDLRSALAATTGDQQPSDIGNYLTLGTSGSNALVQISVTSGGTLITVAVLNGAGSVTLSSFLNHAQLT
jgi:hypothetical protein